MEKQNYDDLDEFKLCSIQINQIVFLYDYLIEKDREEKGENIN